MEINLVIGWGLILLGFVSGAALGMGFHDESWLGGYASFRRRLARLGHIALVALGAVNILFAMTIRQSAMPEQLRAITSALFIVGGFTMPLCCGLTAWRPGARPLFVLPVAALITAAGITLIGVIAS